MFLLNAKKKTLIKSARYHISSKENDFEDDSIHKIAELNSTFLGLMFNLITVINNNKDKNKQNTEDKQNNEEPKIEALATIIYVTIQLLNDLSNFLQELNLCRRDFTKMSVYIPVVNIKENTIEAKHMYYKDDNDNLQIKFNKNFKDICFMENKKPNIYGKLFLVQILIQIYY